MGLRRRGRAGPTLGVLPQASAGHIAHLLQELLPDAFGVPLPAAEVAKGLAAAHEALLAGLEVAALHRFGSGKREDELRGGREGGAPSSAPPLTVFSFFGSASLGGSSARAPLSPSSSESSSGPSSSATAAAPFFSPALMKLTGAE